jgi:hypothetical protein
VPTPDLLLPQHAAMIEASAISPEVATARGYFTATRKAELATLGFGAAQRNVPALVIPIHGVDGEIRTYQSRPDHPRIKDGKPLKYETPRGSRMCLDVPPAALSRLADPAAPLVITEGARKADAALSAGLCCVALLGVWNWRGRNEHEGLTALPDWESVALNGRDVYLCFDSDVNEKPAVYAALKRLKAFLESRGASVKIAYLPPGPGGEKMGLDDFLAAGHTVANLLSHATTELRPPPQEEAESPYTADGHGIYFNKLVEGGTVPVLLANFTARITADTVADDGAEAVRTFTIEAELNGRTARADVPAGKFPALGWVPELLGANAVISPGNMPRQHLPAAIQHLSGSVPERRVYAHTGWRDGIYLHAGGGIGPDGLVPGVEVSLSGPLALFALPDPPEGEALRAAVRASLGMLDVAPNRLTAPLLAAVARALLGAADFGLHMTGPSGAGKTVLAALAQQHSGPGMDSRNLPASWSSTANSLEALAFLAKDVVLVVDDFAPGGSQYDVQRLHQQADRLFRAQGNNSGRGRMRPDGSLRPSKPPRGMILSTGEDVPRGQSLRARLLVLDVPPDAVCWERLTGAQEDARAGLYAAAMAGYVRWLAPQIGALDVRAEVATLRSQMHGEHRRTPEIVANLLVGFRMYLRFAKETGAISPEDAAALLIRGEIALHAAAGAQTEHQTDQEPASRFLALLRAALASGRAHVAAPNGRRPDPAEPWGWRQSSAASDWQPQGDRIGWLDGTLLLEPGAAHAAASRMARDGGEPALVTQRTLNRRLAERGLLIERDYGRETLTVRRILEGTRREVLSLSADALAADDDADGSEVSF